MLKIEIKEDVTNPVMKLWIEKAHWEVWSRPKEQRLEPLAGNNHPPEEMQQEIPECQSLSSNEVVPKKKICRHSKPFWTTDFKNTATLYAKPGTNIDTTHDTPVDLRSQAEGRVRIMTAVLPGEF